ncbi:hypothetical protein C8J56DRAFT_1164129 [Mycena floridula]|nr:hypothetical protein C8J56DRAFT_1164129 [Mycena floridula]
MSTIIQLEQLHEVAFRSPITIVEGNYNGLSSARRKAFGSIDSFWRYRPGKVLALSMKESFWLHLPAVLSFYGNRLHSTAILRFTTSLTSTLEGDIPAGLQPGESRFRQAFMRRQQCPVLASTKRLVFASTGDMINFTLLFPCRRRRLRDRCSFTFQSPVSVRISVTSICYCISLPIFVIATSPGDSRALYRWKEDRMFEGRWKRFKTGAGDGMQEMGYQDRAKTFLSFPLVLELSLSFWGSGSRSLRYHSYIIRAEIPTSFAQIPKSSIRAQFPHEMPCEADGGSPCKLMDDRTIHGFAFTLFESFPHTSPHAI